MRKKRKKKLKKSLVDIPTQTETKRGNENKDNKNCN